MRAFILFLYVVAGVTGQGFSTTFFQNTLFGGDHSDFGVSSWIDQARGVRYIVGQTYSSSFTGVSKPLNGQDSLGAPDILLIKLDQATDSLLWYTVVGTARSDQPRAITGDSEGNVWITGTTFGSFDNSENNGAARGFLIKIDSQGSTLLTKTMENCQPTSMETDTQGNIWVAGSASINNQNSINDDDFASNEDVSVIIFSSTGEQLSTKSFGGAASDIAKTIAVADNVVAIGGVTYSSNFPVTQGSRECDFCSGAGFIMSLTYHVDVGIQQTYSTYILGEEQQSLSVVDITFDALNNMYLAIYDDANAMGAYIQQVKSDRSMGWVSEKSDAFWKVEYLPLIDALYTIGSFSTPTDYATFYVLDTKTGSHIYSSKALTGALVDASVYTVDESSIKIHMIGTLQKDLKITYHGRTFSKVHKSDDVLIVSLTIRSLSAAKKAQEHAKTDPLRDTQSSIAVSNAARDTSDSTVVWCLWNHVAGFAPFNDFLTDVTKYVYSLIEGGVSVILPISPPTWDYDLAHGALVEMTPANAGKPARLAANTWGPTFEIFFNLVLPKLNASMTGVHIPGVSYFEWIVPNPTYGAKIIVSNQGRVQDGDLVAWTVEFVLPFDPSVSRVFTFNPKKGAGINVWWIYNNDLATNHMSVYATTDEITNPFNQRPSTALWSITLDAATKTLWRTGLNFIPKIVSGCTMRTHLAVAFICGLTEKIVAVPIPLAAVLPVTGNTSFPAGGEHGAWVGQVIIPDTDSIPGTQTKFSFLKADGGPYNSPDTWCFVYEGIPFSGKPWDLRKYYAPGYFASAKISGSGNLAGWVFDGKKVFKKGTKYYFYVAEGLFANDNLYVSEPDKVSSLPQKRYIETRDTTTDQPMLLWNATTYKYDEITTQSVVYSATTKPYASADNVVDDTLPPAPDDQGTDGGLIEADPWFVGYNNQKFLFKGTAGQIYNVYNDPWVNVNSLFGFANEKKKTGTVMHTIGISIGEHNLFFDISNRENRRFFDVVINGVTTRVGSSVQHLSGCVDVQYNTKVLLVSTPRHSLRLTIEWGHNWHINVPYFDLNIHHPEEDNYKIGGILGQTAHEGNDDVDLREDDFKVDNIFSFEKSKFYNLQSIDC